MDDWHDFFLAAAGAAAVLAGLSEAYVAVSQKLLHELGIDALPQEERGAGVAEVVKAGRLWEPGALQKSLEVSL